jgi:hypothetical protein
MALTRFHVCHHCKDRHVGCHAECSLYRKEVEENEMLKRKKRMDSEIDDATIDLKNNRIDKLTHSRSQMVKKM